MHRIDIYLIIGMAAGIYFFVKGFIIFREYRVFEDTPEIPIRSMAMGLSHIHGKAMGEKVVESPVTRTQCHFFKVDIERWVQNRNGGNWQHFKTVADGPQFYLDDGTGKVLVDAHQAEYDLVQTVKRATGIASGFNLRGLISGPLGGGAAASLAATGAGPSDNELVAFAQSAQGVVKHSLSVGSLAPSIGWSGGMGFSGMGGRYRFTEYLILPGHWYDVIGTCAENPAAQGADDHNLVMKGQNEPTFLISWRAEKQEEARLKRQAMLRIFGGAALALVCLTILLAESGLL